MLERMSVDLANEKLIKPKDAAKMLGMTTNSLYNNVKKGYIRAVVIDKPHYKKYLFTIKELNRFLNTWSTQKTIIREEETNV